VAQPILAVLFAWSKIPMSLLPTPAFDDPKHHLRIYQSDCLDLLPQLPASSVDLIFADPPYFLSNGGITCHAGKMVSVNKGAWDKLPGPDSGPVRARFDEVHAFNTAWLAAAQRLLKPNGSIWVSGTAHVIHSVGFAMQQLGFKLLNDISWVKPNPPPNLSCRYFTHATETIIWAAKDKKSRHTFHYKLMKETNRGKQMKSVWEINARERQSPDWRLRNQAWRAIPAKHPTQKPVALLERILLASTNEGDTVLDPFLGGGTTLLSALRLSRRAIGCELSLDYINLSVRRLCSNLVQVDLSVASVQFSVDPPLDSVDRSKCVQSSLQLVQQELRFHFIGRADRRVIFTVLADSLEDARAKYRASGRQDADALFIIKTETSIYLV
jgi:site-specific DNA-methyltransferase (adenine-specific)